MTSTDWAQDRWRGESGGPAHLAAVDVMIEAVLQARRPVALAATGGGSLALHWLLDHPGASRAIVDAQVPYHEAALADYLRDAGPHPAVAETARQLALVAAQRACRFGGGEGIGAGATAALATDRTRRGEDRAHVAVRGPELYRTCHLQFTKGAANRHQQEEALSRTLLELLLTAVGGRVDPCPWPVWVRRTEAELAVVEALEDLLAGRTDVAEMPASSRRGSKPTDRHRLLLPGSFNPLHDGHRGLARAASQLSGRRPALELAVVNVDKPPLDYAEILRRWWGVRQEFDLVVTREPTFTGKARHFPGCHFAIGYDTAVRIVDPAYYGSDAQMGQALNQLLQGDCRFLVAGRLAGGRFRTLGSIAIPAPFRPLFVEIPEIDFRLDVSSTELRQETRAGRR